MLESPAPTSRRDISDSIRHRNGAPPVDLPRGYVGPAWLPGTGRMIWWTGRVAIGLRHEPAPHPEGATAAADWIQSLILN